MGKKKRKRKKWYKWGREKLKYKRTTATQCGTSLNSTWEWEDPAEQEPGVPGEKGKFLMLTLLATLTKPLLILPNIYKMTALSPNQLTQSYC